MAREFREDDVGKTVVIADGTEIGMVSEVTGDTARIEPGTGVTDRIKSRLGWSGSDQDTYSLAADEVESITDDEIRLSAGGVDVT